MLLQAPQGKHYPTYRLYHIDDRDCSRHVKGFAFLPQITIYVLPLFAKFFFLIKLGTYVAIIRPRIKSAALET